jgi:hypothetical protein
MRQQCSRGQSLKRVCTNVSSSKRLRPLLLSRIQAHRKSFTPTTTSYKCFECRRSNRTPNSFFFMHYPLQNQWHHSGHSCTCCGADFEALLQQGSHSRFSNLRTALFRKGYPDRFLISISQALARMSTDKYCLHRCDGFYCSHFTNSP